jgi:CheY-like chemotaxis protein
MPELATKAEPEMSYVEQEIGAASADEEEVPMPSADTNPSVDAETQEIEADAAVAEASIDTVADSAPFVDRMPSMPTRQVPQEPISEQVLDACFDATEPEFDIVGTPPANEVEAPRRMRVLVAEDNKTNRFVLEKMVKSLNIDLVFAENGLEAVDQYQWQKPDVFFTDISMPKMDGKEAARRIRGIEQDEKLAHCPIVAITAHAMEGDADEILSAGIDYYLTKPVKKAELIEHILAARPDNAEEVLPQEEAQDQATAASG